MADSVIQGGRGSPRQEKRVVLPNAVWEPDTVAEDCRVCERRFFGLMVRRHHCRVCGRLVCDDCSKWRVQIGDREERACKACADKVEDARSTRVWHAVGGNMWLYFQLAEEDIATLSLDRLLELLTKEGIAEEHQSAVIDALRNLQAPEADFLEISARVARADSPQISPRRKADRAAVPDDPMTLEQYHERINTFKREEAILLSLVAAVDQTHDQYEDLLEKVHELEEKREDEKRERLERMKKAREAEQKSNREVRQRKSAFIVKNHHSSECRGCSREFTVTRREHHCRGCFHSVCAKCSRKRERSDRLCDMCVGQRVVFGDRLMQQCEADNEMREFWAVLLERAADDLEDTIDAEEEEGAAARR
eukprot:TRINITY_DN5696_c0_g1_i3.p1 TRINITY_DN5696_c0_g1~~TRINITY_DN5696_c0_g1_i3.p1  ORF type:complete len:390 (+),score=122.73 TRINITY_DN5696_c0_g1_i3:76-1170(+)